MISGLYGVLVVHREPCHGSPADGGQTEDSNSCGCTGEVEVNTPDIAPWIEEWNDREVLTQRIYGMGCLGLTSIAGRAREGQVRHVIAAAEGAGQDVLDLESVGGYRFGSPTIFAAV